MSIQIKIQTDSLFHVPFQSYQKDFTFIVNGEKYQTNKFFADLISPNISNLHMNDPTASEYTINTCTKGNFQRIIDLTSFKEEKISDTEIQFISEIFQQLGTEKVTIKAKFSEINKENIIESIKIHEKAPFFYKEQLLKEIDFLSEHFHEIISKNEDDLLNLSHDIIYKVVNNEHLLLESEDELLLFIMKLYEKDHHFAFLFEFVYFSNVESASIEKFLAIFDIEYLTVGAWTSISTRLIEEVKESKIKNEKSRYLQVKTKLKKGIEIKYSNENYNGVFNYLRKNSNIDDEVNATYWPTREYDVKCLTDFSNTNSFYTQDKPNSWICFEFKKHKIIPSNYTIKSHNCDSNGCHPKSWRIEGSNDNNEWIQLDKQENCTYLNGRHLIHTFDINNNEEQEFKYIRMYQTGPNCQNSNQLALCSIEFYGRLL